MSNNKKMKREIVLRGSCQTNSDIFYFTGVAVPDPFYAFTLRGKKCALVGALELGRLRNAGRLDEVFDLSLLSEKFGKGIRLDDTGVLIHLLKKSKIKAIVVSADFPALQLEKLRGAGFDVAVSEKPLFPERDIKNNFEMREIAKANAIASLGFERIENILRESKISGRKIIWHDNILTSEILRYEVEKTSLSKGADALYTIVAGGNQACNPHEVGHGAILPNSLIVADIFPRLRSTGYFGDMTRTFLKGEPTSAQSSLVETVIKAQKLALSKVKDGVDGSVIHNAVDDFFAKNGYFTEFKKGAWGGFFHSTGHGVGLDIHEKVSISPHKCILKTGNVITVEPGLYYRGIGGCRIEDTVAVEKNGMRKLSKYHYNWVIK